MLSLRSEYFRKIFMTKTEEMLPDERPVVRIDNTNVDIFTQMLTFIYTDTCDLLSIGKTFKFDCKDGVSKEQYNLYYDDTALMDIEDGKRISAFEVYEKKRKKKSQGKEKAKPEVGQTRNPVKLLQEMAKKFGVKGLAKR